MYKLARMHLDSVGSSSARFADLVLDFTDDEHNPLDSIVWLRNGGGKTSLLALFFSLFLPYRRDFLGWREDRRTLGDYVLTGDTAHVVCEWETPSGPLVTGAVYEWPERKRPLEHEKHASELVTRFYVFNPKAGVLGFDALPVKDEANKRRNLESFLRELRAAGKAHPLTNLVVVSSGTDWRSALLDRGIDPAVFKYQKEMNKGEGAIDEQFRFASGESFVNFLIEMVVDSEASDSVSTRMSTLATKLAAKPGTQLELDYCEGVAERLGPIAGLWEDRGRWRTLLDEATAGANTLGGALAAAAEVAGAEQVASEAARDEAEGRRLEAERVRTTARDRRQEYARRGAEFWVQEATARIEGITATQNNVAGELAGWTALEHLFALESAEAQIADIDRQLSAVRADSEPLRVARNDAARRLYWRYGTGRDEARVERDMVVELCADLDASAAAHDVAVGEAREAVGKLANAIEGAQRDVEAIDASLEAAIGAGQLGRGVDPAEALREAEVLGADTDAAIDRLEAEVQSRTDRQSALVDAERERGGEELRIAAVLETAQGAADRLGAEATSLARHERVRELTQSDEVSVWGVHQMLDVKLGEEIERADGALVGEEVGAKRDRRNRDALGDGGLLPPSSDTEAMLGILSAAGISAVPGLAYLSASVSRRNWEATIAAHPGLLAGILVDPADFEAARDALIEAREHPASLVTLAPKSALETEGELAFVVPPTAALYDQEAADAERQVLDARLGDLERRKAVLVASREADRELRSQVKRFIEECPAGHLESLAREIGGHETTLGQLGMRRDELAAERSAIAEFLSGAGAKRRELQSTRTEISARCRTLGDLVEKGAHREDLVRAIADDEAALVAARTRAETETQAATDDRRAGDEQRDKARELRSRIDTLETALGGVELRGEGTWGDAEIDGPGAGVATEALERELVARDEEYAQAVSDPVLEERRRRAVLDRSGAQEQLRAQGEAAIERAGALRVTPAALDASTRAERVRDLGNRSGDLNREHALAEVDLERAEDRRRETTPPTRPVHRALDPEELPTSRADAEAREAVEEAEAQRAQLDVTKAEGEVAAAKEAGRAAKARADMLAVLVSTMAELVGDGFVASSSGVEAFAGSDEEATAAHTGAAQALREARKGFEKTEERLSDAVTELRSFASAADFAGAGSLREPIVVGVVDDVARRAGALADAHLTRAAVLRVDLESIAADQAILVSDLAGQVRGVLDLLKKAPQISVMDQSLGEWANKSFLTIKFDDAIAADELARRVSGEIDAIIAKGDTPEGLATLKRAVRAAVPDGFRVRVLKPTADLHEERVAVSAMSKWSGGEKLTAAVVLYCIVARLRARNRSRALPLGSSGALVLDNPLGKSNYVGFLAVQRRVATALGVQLLYTTGVRDLKAVGTFPNVIRCRNRRAASTDRGYVVATERAGEAHGTSLEAMGVVSSARVVRLDPTSGVVAELDDELGGTGDGVA